MSDDPYKILGIPKDATQDAVKAAYRKLAKDLHPDLNPGDSAAESRFKQVSAAYRLLNDPEMRARYDRGEIDASGAEKPEQRFYREYADQGRAGRYHSSAGYEDFENVSDIFAEMFAGREKHGVRMKGRDAVYHLEIAFMDAANGATRRVTMPDGKSLDVTIPAGTRDGSMLRLEGKGGPGIGGGPPGDALIEVAVTPHALFQREGDDIVVDLPISLDEAVLGGQIEVPTVSGRVKVRVPKGASGGQVLRLKGRGVKSARRKPGDQLVRLRVVMPEQVDPELEEFMRSWRKEHGYDPRAAMERRA